ncbi:MULTISPECIES: PEP/pyruvate-binding domain-containing protein [unclassified Burkholderia]|uniref:PEP/pyruvate-binding domain-containing protein n=1 Tax=unclassified Burkholderia TaxID=2613784 RepID=UPI001421C24D|nr:MULTISPECIES: PEP/pyruvate-binding domain-containing protein [unclassified Burkholderia]NIE82521.1 phosphoenolpyruvate synthase [Burkholderia sp. Tr-860]NIF61298.1 phosphoenolpyruvate synthase [Burkholderia sp. Cy-647]NIF94503.1 phosphoenolpyruvate synthase [Burkholderia sp. Ax-1720]
MNPIALSMTLVRGGPDALDARLVGNKFARLARMREAGMNVPDLFCVPAPMFDAAQALAATALGPVPVEQPIHAAGDPIAGRCAALAGELATLVMPARWVDTLLAEFDARFGPDALVAVRACVVPAVDANGRQLEDGEDSSHDPFAGMSDSFLYVTRAHLAETIARCWASAYTERAVRYRLWRGLDPSSARVAVGVQRMIEGNRSFVAFTRDPRDSERRVVIAAAHGIGEGVVQEKADVDHFFVEAGRVRTQTVTKRAMVVRDGQRGNGELVIVAVPEALAALPVLGDDEARRVAQLALAVEAHFGCAQDIEGALTADGTIHLVQARPMVARHDAPPLYWCNYNITESYPGVSSALTYSQSQLFYQRAFGDLYHRMGVPAARLDAHRHHLEQLVAWLDGRIYYRLDAWHALHGQMPVFELMRSIWEEAMGVTGPARERPRWTTARALAGVPGLLLRRMRHAAQVREFLGWWDALMREAGDLSGHAPDQLIAFYRRMWAQVGVRWGVTLTNSLYAMLELRVFKALLRRWTGADVRTLAGLLIGGRPNRSLLAVRAVVALAEQAGAHPAFRAALLDRDSAQAVPLAELWRALAGHRYGAALADAALAYLARYGDRAMHDLKLEEPTPRQQPWMLLNMLMPYVRRGISLATLEADEARAAHEADQELARRCPSRLRRAVLRGFARRAREYVAMREDMRFCRTQLYGLSRQVMWTLGAALAKADRLDRPQQVHDLSVSEVMGAFDGTLAGSRLRELAVLRRAERDACVARPAAEILLATPRELPVALALERAAPVLPDVVAPTLQGLGSSAGVVRARARRVLEPDISADSCQGTILVARETDPGWLFLMMAAKGLVVERGTLLSHTAITGRLLGIPTVVAVANATTLIPDGALIEIDGGAGTIRIIDPAPDAVDRGEAHAEHDSAHPAL